MAESFVSRFFERILHDVYLRQSENVDERRFPDLVDPSGRFQRSVKDAAAAFFANLGFAYVNGVQPTQYAVRLNEVVERRDEFERLYRLLEDEESRTLLVAVLAFRVLGHRHVRLPLNTAEYRGQIQMIRQRLVRKHRTLPMPPLGYLDEYDLSSLGSEIRLQAHLLSILNTFVLQQYRLHRPAATIEASSGDVAIDAGACWGDTTLYFSDRVGISGRVIAYEFSPDNLEILNANLAQNPELAKRVQLISRALSDKPNQTLTFTSQGPGTQVRPQGEAANSVITDSLDFRVAEDRLPLVSFIKMDIEGGELEALRGAEETLRRWRPKLAISVYHKLDHFWQIPDFINNLNLGYRFYLDHFTIHSEETVLFAIAK